MQHEASQQYTTGKPGDTVHGSALLSRSRRGAVSRHWNALRSALPFALWIALWITASAMTGSMLMSFHQPFRAPGQGILSLTAARHPDRPRMLHILSGSCGCSQKIMQHLATRRVYPGFDEQVLMIDSARADNADYLPGSRPLLRTLEAAGFPVIHLAESRLPSDAGLRGVPLLVMASSSGEVTYSGGYGIDGSEDTRLLHSGLAASRLRAEPVFGCAIGASLRKKTDPFGLKYGRD